MLSFQSSFGDSIGVLKTANYRNTQMKLFYNEDKAAIATPRVKFIRNRKVIFDKGLKFEDQSQEFKRIAPPVLLDLDDDWEPEGIVELSTDRNNCCNYSVIFSYDKKKRTYSTTIHNWGAFVKGRKLEDLDKDGVIEFISQDVRFATDTNQTLQSKPIRIWQFKDKKMTDVTVDFPELIKADALKAWNQVLETKKSKKQDSELQKALLKTYLADKYLLKQETEGWQKVKEVYKGKDKDHYFEDLQKLLEDAGYASSTPRKN